MDADGNATRLRAGTFGGNTVRRVTVPLPAWSPKGDLLLTTELAPGTQPQLSPGAVTIDRSGQAPRVTLQTQFGFDVVTIDRSGEATRLTALRQLGRGPVVWSPDGSAVAAVGPSVAGAVGSDPANSPDADLGIRVATLDGSSRGTVPGREVVWSKSGLYVLSNGFLDPAKGLRTGQAIEVVDPAAQRPLTYDTARRPLVTIASLLADPRAQVPAGGAVSQTATQLTASPDGAYLGLRLSYGVAQGAGASRFFTVLVRTADGRPSTYLPGEVSDLAWSPARATIGYTAYESRGQGALTTRAQVATIVDATSGETLAKLDGRFAGWSPDGAGYYVARDIGLYFAALGASDPLRIGPVGVPVSATAAP